uniref:Fibronectin type III domain containing 10 n=1 Tax=Echeneis naucrates TaxID=173247 RepID=A0A665TKX4_ECHNA
MTNHQRPSLLALSALLLCTLHQTAGSSGSHRSSSASSSSPSSPPTSASAGRNNVGTLQDRLTLTNISGSHSHKSRPSPKLEAVTVCWCPSWIRLQGLSPDRASRPAGLCRVYSSTLWDARHCDCHDNSGGGYLCDAGHHLLAGGIYHRKHHEPHHTAHILLPGDSSQHLPSFILI